MTGEHLYNLLSELKGKGDDLSNVRFNFVYHCNHSKYADDINLISLATFSSTDGTLTITFASRASDMDAYDNGAIERNLNHFLKSLSHV